MGCRLGGFLFPEKRPRYNGTALYQHAHGSIFVAFCCGLVPANLLLAHYTRYTVKSCWYFLHPSLTIGRSSKATSRTPHCLTRRSLGILNGMSNITRAWYYQRPAIGDLYEYEHSADIFGSKKICFLVCRQRTNISCSGLIPVNCTHILWVSLSGTRAIYNSPSATNPA